MSDLMDKIAALPKDPDKPSPCDAFYDWEQYYADRAFYLAAHNALLCEVLNRCVPYLDRGMETLHSDIRAVLAACEVKP